jgi:hypothetical protein
MWGLLRQDTTQPADLRRGGVSIPWYYTPKCSTAGFGGAAIETPDMTMSLIAAIET